ncbi:hypothetical protein MNBD_GAMMA13-910 [hydrothermal vent metagenome]|uniref:histidine kinase n=1 Tax=hydrothermal vent metagenome TaxID=652676 RepID=A0A3B0YYX9_9ZZZZ
MNRRELSRLFSTSAVHIALWYVCVYVLLVGAALLVFYWASSRYVDAQLEAGLQQEFVSLRDLGANEGVAALAAAIEKRSQAGSEQGRFYLLVDATGDKLAGNFTGWPEELDDRVSLDESVHTAWIDDDMNPIAAADEDSYWPVIGKQYQDGGVLVVARSVEQSEALQMFSIYALSGLLLVIVALALAMGLFIGRSILGRIDKIIETAASIMCGEFAQRMPLSDRGDEFDELSTRLNDMLSRIEHLMQGMRDVTDNVAHDLRSPLTRMRNRLDVVLLEHRSPEEYRQEIELAITDSEELMRSFNAILQIAQTEAGAIRSSMEAVDLAGLATTVSEFYRPVAQQHQQCLIVDAASPVSVSGNRDLLSQALGNLLDNAIKYTPDGGLITVTAIHTGVAAQFSIADNGLGIPAAERDRVLQRFVRLDQARSSPGNGLGLSLVSAVAGLHSAALELGDNGPGLIVTLSFPAELT